MTVASRPQADLAELIAALAALEEWAAEPTRPRRLLVRGLEMLASACGAVGAHLEAAVEPPASIAAGWGTLVRRPGRSGRGSVVTAPLHGAVGGTSPDRARDVVGTLWLDGPERHVQDAVRLVELAVARARERGESARAERRLTALDEAIRAMAGILAVDRVLQVIVERVRILTGARYAALGVHDQAGAIEQFITSGINRPDRARIGAPPRGHGLLGVMIRENRTIRLDDLMTDPRRVGFPPNHPEMHPFLGVPVVIRGRTLGNLYLTEKEGGFTDEDQREIETFARHVGIAMENARLHEQVQRLAVVEERERIGKDLHDGVIQAIYAVGLSLDDVPDMMDGEPDEARRRVERAIDSLDQTIRDIRNFIFGLRPALLDGGDVVEGLAALADEFRVNTMIDVELRAGPTVTTPVIGADRTVELLAIAREALSNIARHARATRAEITVEPDPDVAGVEIVVADNGTGFDPAAPRGVGHQGLRNMRTRAISIGATLLVDSRPGAGTRIIVRVPGARTADDDEIAGGPPDA
ncbi:MAG TPA: GAF domain-containing sensor histidine kinase [Candidatus Nanopelagicales bacterium]|nr:GAF domain-containing sensor histidine kinase [Candidatus Nanopelagicales bacterium]